MGSIGVSFSRGVDVVKYSIYPNYLAAVVLYHISCIMQGGHALWKTGKMVKKNSLQGKIREFEILLKISEKSGNFRKSYLCKVKIFKFYSYSDVATRGGWRPYILPVLILTTMKVN